MLSGHRADLKRRKGDKFVHSVNNVPYLTKNLKPHPYAAWIKELPKGVGEPLTLGLLHETRHLTNCVQYLRARLNLVENDFDLTIELEGYTKADILEHAFDDVTVLYGVLPSTKSSIPQHASPLTHREKKSTIGSNLAKVG